MILYQNYRFYIQLVWSVILKKASEKSFYNKGVSDGKIGNRLEN